MNPEHSPLRRILYPLYVGTLFGAVYGITTVQAAARPIARSAAARTTFDTWALPVVGFVVAVLLAAAVAVGGRRGPVVPDIGFIDLLLPTPHDRALLLREWWRASLAALTVVGILAGGVLGVGLAISGLLDPAAAAYAVVAGAAVGTGVAHLALRAESLVGAPPAARSVLRTRAALAHLHRPVLRAQATLSRTASAAVLVGDLGHLRREGAIGSTRDRSRRLRPQGRVGTLVGAELLIWRRTPWRTALGLALIAVGTPALVQVIGDAAVTVALGPLLLVVSLGTGRLLPGLRSLADNGGSPTLLGLTPKTAAVAHLTIGLAPVTGVAIVSLIWIDPLDPGPLAGALACVLSVGGIQLFAGFRGGPDLGGLLPQTVPTVIAFWLALPYATPLLLGLLAHQLTSTETMPVGPALLALSPVALALGWWQLSVQTAPETATG